MGTIIADAADALNKECQAPTWVVSYAGLSTTIVTQLLLRKGEGVPVNHPPKLHSVSACLVVDVNPALVTHTVQQGCMTLTTRSDFDLGHFLIRGVLGWSHFLNFLLLGAF